ncbi:CYTH and CHAD domain-containing protein [Bordetella sp. H567]|uniref:CYTH and CHAD domain-containing protein n=1 Tax=Bordetella sp. H567 TaxID=1697043 RepID=UPI000832DB7B|nr:CYTH and CHAD domain-containing protein [Bordetella sp. H567]
MSEQELKLHVPTASRAAVERELKQAGAERLPLHAMYFDTPERELAKARIAIRLRREGRKWVQTLKTPGANAITRVEMNHPRPGPILDLSVYAGTEVHGALAGLKGELELRYETDVIRLVRKTRTRQGTVEIAYDSGVLRAGELELPISEVEFELMSGRPGAIFAMARGWLSRYGLVLDPRSKSERGDGLARLAHTLAQAGMTDDARRAAIAQFWGPRVARSISLSPGMTPPQGLAAVAAECLDQVMRNGAMLAEVDTLDVYGAGQPEHVHQLRVGMRRLRSAWRLFRGWAELPSDEAQSALRVHFAAFGANRDQDVLQESIIPALVKAGMPTFPIPQDDAPPASALDTAGSKAFQSWLLDMLEWTLDVRPTPQALHAAGQAGEAGQANSHGRVRGDGVRPPTGDGHARAGVDGDDNGVDAADGAQADEGTDASDANGASRTAVAQGRGGNAGARGATLRAAPARSVASVAAGGKGQDAIDDAAAPGATADGATPPAMQSIHPTIIPLTPPEPRELRTLLARRLRKWHKQVLDEGERFAELDIPSRHELRKRAKRLRYGLSFAESLLPAHKMRDYRRRLAAVQDVLGEMNDLSVAHDLYRQWSSRHPQAWFALGWISARQEKLTGEAQRAFGKLGQAKRFWK